LNDQEVYEVLRADPATAGGWRGSIFVVWEKLTASGVSRRKKRTLRT
jgi:hypothetical protein